MSGTPMEFLEQIEKAERFFSMGFAVEAEALFTRILSHAPEQPRVLNNLGVISFQRGELSKAEDYLVKALTVQPDYEDAWTNLNQVFSAQGKSKETAEALRRLLHRNRNSDVGRREPERWATEGVQVSGNSPPRPSNPTGAPESGLKPSEENNTEAVHYSPEPDALDEAAVSRRSPEPATGAFPGEQPEEDFPEPQEDRSSVSALPHDKNSSEPAPPPLPASEDHTAHPAHSRPRYASRPPLPTVSVGLPVYNGGKYLAEAVESILSQDFEDFELIISDNHSTDDTPGICEKYARMDERIRYVRQQNNIGVIRNVLHVLGLSVGRYFMWATHDDLHAESFIRKCLQRISKDESIVLVYPKTQLLNSDSQPLGISHDYIPLDQNTPTDRFLQLIWNLSICNMFFGLYKSALIKHYDSWLQTLFADNLFLARAALTGKILYIDEPLFFRRFTRNYKYESHDDRYVQLISDCDPCLFKLGLYMPHCRLTYAHLDLINQSNISSDEKNVLIGETLKCFRYRYGTKMTYEIDRTVRYVTGGIYFYTWQNNPSEAASFRDISQLGYYQVSTLLKMINEAILIYPERYDLLQCHAKCLSFLNNADRASLLS